jgi:hypothetical protein
MVVSSFNRPTGILRTEILTPTRTTAVIGTAGRSVVSAERGVLDALLSASNREKILFHSYCAT